MDVKAPLLFLACSFKLCICLAAPEGAIQVVSAYSAAFNKNDCHTMLELLSPREKRNLIRDLGDSNGFCQLMGELHAAGARDRLRAPTASLSSGTYRMVIVPTTRFAATGGGRPLLTEGVYVVHSSDSGSTWNVLDLGCIDDRWVKDVYPPYDGYPKIGPATGRLLTQGN